MSREFGPYYALLVPSFGGKDLKSPCGQRTTVVLYSDIGTARRNRGKTGEVLKVMLTEVSDG